MSVFTTRRFATSTFTVEDFDRWMQVGYEYANPFARCAYTDIEEAASAMHSEQASYRKLSEADQLEADDAFENGWVKRTSENITTRQVADGLGVTLLTVKRWGKSGMLSPDFHNPRLNLYHWDTIHTFRQSNLKYGYK